MDSIFTKRCGIYCPGRRDETSGTPQHVSNKSGRAQSGLCAMFAPGRGWYSDVPVVAIFFERTQTCLF